MSKFVLSVGQCPADHASITAVIRNLGAEIDSSDSIQDALETLSQRPYALVLVNRILDSTDDEGVELVKRMQDSPFLREVPVMLVSNFDSAQNEAVTAGAVRGFGKAALDEPDTAELLSKYLS